MNEPDHLIPTYARQPLAFSHGEGVWLTDTAGNRYLDALAGIAVSALGHAHPAMVQALQDQAAGILHTSNLYRIPHQEALADRLCDLAGMEAVFFCNSGAEANEAAIKLARLHGHRQGIEEPRILVMEGAFHGRTLASLAATGNPKAQKGFGPMPAGFVRVPYGDADAVAAHADDPNVVAVLVEPIQGEGGIRVPPPGYLPALRRLCDQQGWLLMADEVQTGVGRTGNWFAYQHDAVQPDVVSLAKGLGGGVPIGATLVAGRATALFGPGSHGSTFGGNPLACRAALAVISTIEAEGLTANAAARGEQLATAFRDGLANGDGVITVRGRGLMLGIELDRPCAVLVERAREAGVLLNVTAERVVRLLPPLILTAAEADDLADRVTKLIRSFLAE
ncbi:acetylornithine transaminase [Spectribacter hydrogenoxidans]|uniref:Acetylornithine aminotransferase n=1 Tax=Spectribacter hydrogenoxidans TaxID=3075608 RepID=A0ABU3BXJ0_9GAMM|nr:acetylornithine transaminase [Salinisphaera sp. W335]MDT0634032.1 acetylornithine transaminase [Salinisphaera sp. W335]